MHVWLCPSILMYVFTSMNVSFTEAILRVIIFVVCFKYGNSAGEGSGKVIVKLVL